MFPIPNETLDLKLVLPQDISYVQTIFRKINLPVTAILRCLTAERESGYWSMHILCNHGF